MTMSEQLQYGYFGHIAKWEKTEDGTLMVYGKAAGPDLDLDGQRCDPAWLKTAMPAWHVWGNVREQHANIAAGVGVELTQDGDDWYLKAEIVDAGTIRKVEKRVLKGFSVGIINGRVIKSAKAPNGVIDDGTVAEVSLVDRPCNPTAMMSIAKSAGGPTLEPVEVQAEDVPDAPFIEPRGPQATEGVPVEKSVGWYRESLRLVEDTLAGRWSHTVPFISKAAAAANDDDRAEVTGAYAAMDQILDLIIAEAGQAKGGRVKELRDIEVLISACRSLCCFIECEQDEGMTGEVADGDIDMAYMSEGTYAKAFGIWGADDETVRSRISKDASAAPGSTAGDTVDDAATVEAATAEIITKAVAAAQAESARTHEAELATLRAQLEKAQAAPLTGGPVTFSTVLKTSSAPGQTVPLVDSAHWRKLAEDPNLSSDVRRAYLAKAASLSQGAST
jgi:hypothetical protein